jgi:hypothetical protein
MLQSHGVITTLGADSGEEITSNTFIAVAGLREGKDVSNLEVLRVKVSLLPVL